MDPWENKGWVIRYIHYKPSDWIRSDERSEISSVKGVSQLSLLWEVLGNCLNMLAQVYFGRSISGIHLFTVA